MVYLHGKKNSSPIWNLYSLLELIFQYFDLVPYLLWENRAVTVTVTVTLQHIRAIETQTSHRMNLGRFCLMFNFLNALLNLLGLVQ